MKSQCQRVKSHTAPAALTSATSASTAMTPAACAGRTRSRSATAARSTVVTRYSAPKTETVGQALGQREGEEAVRARVEQTDGPGDPKVGAPGGHPAA
jgi:hypothetical protein